MAENEEIAANRHSLYGKGVYQTTVGQNGSRFTRVEANSNSFGGYMFILALKAVLRALIAKKLVSSSLIQWRNSLSNSYYSQNRVGSYRLNDH